MHRYNKRLLYLWYKAYHTIYKTTPLTSFSVLAFTEMTRYLMKLPDSDSLFLLSERFSQDPLENYFGSREAEEVARCDNPTIVRCLQLKFKKV